MEFNPPRIKIYIYIYIHTEVVVALFIHRVKTHKKKKTLIKQSKWDVQNLFNKLFSGNFFCRKTDTKESPGKTRPGLL